MTRVLLAHEPPDGGVARHVLMLSTYLKSQGFDPEVAGPREAIFRDEIEGAGVRFHELPFTRKNNRPHQELQVTWQLARLLRRRGADLVHSHSSKAGVHARLAGKMVGVPSVYTPHCFAFIGPVSRQRRVLATVAERFLATLTRQIICVSESEHREALTRKVASAEKLSLALQGIPDPLDGQFVAPQLGAMRTRGPVIGALNVLRPQKRTDVFLDSIPLVWERHPEAQFVVVGNGPERDLLRQRAADLGVLGDPRFAFISFESPTDKYLLGMDLFVLTSDWEGLPIAVLEAMSLGVPQVVSRIAGNTEAVSASTGCFVDPGSSVQLARCVNGLLDSPERLADLREGSRERFRAKFRFETMAAEIVGAYERALAVGQTALGG